MTHALHNNDADYDIHEQGLADGCDRCAFLAKHLLGLDNRMLDALLARVEAGNEPRSDNEATAMRQIRDAQTLTADLNAIGAARRRSVQ